MKVKLKNCPYCGGKVKIINVADDSDDEYYMVQCENDDECGAGCCFGEGTKEEIAKRWNRRANDEQR